jgi:hypothetical protein
VSKHNGTPGRLALFEAIETLEARNAALTDALTRVLALVRRDNAFMPHRDQLTLREAEALLAEGEG